ncbi:fungal-specific transcription factor domain-containing protein [Irpex rosettiformis]|uniref:Fungal-specific transcription factor domain-containing protein n=1 Tax=Irpex rosettiformis TaxID=378272 RepID=A0ACB8UDD6_9APHY|nr:fungal-specific transcription factor domain-containing protein [Irpex rosettiformis]
MSSGEESDPGPSRSRRKSRRPRACDMCRRRKGNGSKDSGDSCANCTIFQYKCTYVQNAPRRVPNAGYVASLEGQLAELQSLLAQYRRIYPNSESAARISQAIFHPTAIDTIQDTLAPSSFEGCEASGSAHKPLSTPSVKSIYPLSPIPTPTLTDEEPEFDPSEDEVSTSKIMMARFARSPLFHGTNSYQGKSSSMMMIRAALDSKREYVEERKTANQLVDFGSERRDEIPHADGTTERGKERAGCTKRINGPLWHPDTRVDAWSDHPWILKTVNQPQTRFEFPPPDLLDQLLGIYFSQNNCFIPLLHQPTFERDVRDGLHLRNEGFGSVLLLVCAMAAKKCDDPRVLLEEERRKNDKIERGEVLETGEHHRTYHSAGWMWFEQVQKSRLWISFRPATLYDLQVAYLVASCTWETSMSWHGGGYGIRIAQMMGAHRKKSYGEKPTIEGELKKRAFWALVHHDRAHSSIFGHPCSINDEDFDVDLPIVCDDEYWEQDDPGRQFQQPKGKPSKVAYFNCLLRLSQIHSYTLRTIYSINRSKTLLGLVGKDWQARIIAQIDSSLNRWLASVPSHLRWNSTTENGLFYTQSANMHAAYYTLRIIVYRPFIPSPRNHSSSLSPFLSLSTNAARSCIYLLCEQFKQTGNVQDQFALFTSAIAILLNVWAERNSMTSSQREMDMQQVYQAMEIVQKLEPWGRGSGKIWDTLNHLIAMGDSELSMPEQSQSSSKRTWSGHLKDPNVTMPPLPVGGREVAGLMGVQQDQEQLGRAQAAGLCIASGSSSSNDTLVMSSLPSQGHQLNSHSFDHAAGCNTHTRMEYGLQTQPPTFTVSPLGSEYPVTHPPNDSMVEALLNMLAPAQYQQPGIPPAESHGDTGALWNEGVLASDMSDGIPTTTIASLGSGSSPQTVVPGGIPEIDPLSMWYSAPSGFEWEDWGAYLTNFRQNND